MGEWKVTQDSGKLRDLETRFKVMGRGDLQRKLRRNLRDAGRPVVADLRQAVMGVDVTSSKGGTARPDSSTGLRARVAKAVTVSTARRGVQIKVPARKVGGEHGRTLPKYLDSELSRYKRWRSPVFGRMDQQWSVQQGQPWFFVTIRRHRERFQRAALDAVDEAFRKL